MVLHADVRVVCQDARTDVSNLCPRRKIVAAFLRNGPADNSREGYRRHNGSSDVYRDGYCRRYFSVLPSVDFVMWTVRDSCGKVTESSSLSPRWFMPDSKDPPSKRADRKKSATQKTDLGPFVRSGKFLESEMPPPASTPPKEPEAAPPPPPAETPKRVRSRRKIDPK